MGWTRSCGLCFDRVDRSVSTRGVAHYATRSGKHEGMPIKMPIHSL